jgi:hypothetical protein
MPHGDGEAGHGPGVGMLMLAMAAFVVAGVPLVYVLWNSLNHALAGDLGAIQPLVTLAAAVGIGVLAWVLARVIRRWTAT